MVKYIIAKQLVGKLVVSVDGFRLGRFVDADINEITGKINGIIIEPDPDSDVASKLGKNDNGQLSIPYNAVSAVNDYIMIDRKGVA
ncbi:MAG: PRC-barrel domain-containing protein [Candidatus Marsarchaeota archaeon]|jgi:sporulation protein YlmC with PRC-barrel domain|nr:PRC-barrel domain-containing protein [Candidatus Marsarchaeota archaeon]